MPVDPAVVEMLRDELTAAGDRGEMLTREQMRNAIGLGATDLQAALDVLRDAGEVSEIEPDRFRRVIAGDDAPPEPAAPAGEMPAAPPVRRQERVTAMGEGGSRVEFGRDASVTMPRAMVDNLSPEVLGGMLKAGIEAAQDNEVFVFEVTP